MLIIESQWWRWACCAMALWAPLVWGAGFEPWPGTQYDAAIPTSRDVLGYDVGERISSPEALQTYFEALAEAAPNRTRLVEYARSWEGRPLSYLVIGSAANIARLDDIKTGMQALADPRVFRGAAHATPVRR